MLHIKYRNLDQFETHLAREKETQQLFLILRGGDTGLSPISLRLRDHASLFLRRPSTGIFGGFSGRSGPHS
jgi:hypothetical protein